MQRGFTTSVRLTAFSLLLIASAGFLSAQDIITVTGSIMGGGETLLGATVTVVGTGAGTAADLDGNYEIQVPSDGTLEFSFVGFASKQVPVEGRTSIDVTLDEDFQRLDEVVVVGYGTQQKKYVTGSVAKVTGESLQDNATTSVDAALQGRAAGVQVTTSSGITGAPVSIRVRGTSSFSASSEPLYVVDGVPIISGNASTNNANNWGLATAQESNALTMINPADIESIEILKDASSAAIYGARGANGVVLITTKSGKAGKTKFNFNYYTGISEATNRVDMLDTDEYIELAQEAWANAGRPIDNDYELFWKVILPDGLDRETAENTNTDWIDEALRTGFLQEASLSASGGNAKTRFFVGGTFRDEKGILVGDELQRISGRINIDHNFNDKLSIGARASMTSTDRDLTEVAWAGGLGLAQSTALPFYPIYNEDGTFFQPQAEYNLVAERAHTTMQQVTTSYLGNVFVKYQVVDGLSILFDGGINNLYTNEHYYKSPVIRPLALATDVVSESPNWNTNLQLNYNKEWENHALEMLVGGNALKSTYTAHQIDGEDFANPALTNPENAVTQFVNINTTAFSFASLLSRMSYRYKGKYVLTATYRRDGSSRFGNEDRWGNFPAASVGWIVSDEAFMQNQEVLSLFKVRASIGLTGNAEIGNFRYFGSFGSNDYLDNAGISLSQVENPGLGWETTRQTDIGVELGFADGRWQAQIDLYRKDTRDLLSDIAISPMTGATSSTENIAELRNQGVELSITSHNIISGDFRWSTDLNVSYNENQLTNLNGSVVAPGLFGGVLGVEEGLPLGTYFFVPFAGVAETETTYTVTNEDGTTSDVAAEGGDWLFINQYDEVTPIYNPNDARFIGNSVPKWTGGLNNNFSYKGFDLNVLVTFAAGHQIANEEQRFQNVPFGFSWTGQDYLLDRWQEDGDVTDVPKMYWLDEGRDYLTDRLLYDADFVRIKTVTLGYALSREKLAKMKLDRLRFYVRGTNLFTFTSYPGWDPEYNRDESGNVGQGRSWLPTPQARTAMVGVDLTF